MSDWPTTTVSPRPNAFGWLTSAVSVIRTTSEPCATAAGVTRTFAPITTVPVRELTMTLAAAAGGLDLEVLDVREIRDALRLRRGARTRTEIGVDRLRRTPAPSDVLIDSASRAAVVKSGVFRFSTQRLCRAERRRHHASRRSRRSARGPCSAR